jgi:superfamily II RNA helicase
MLRIPDLKTEAPNVEHPFEFSLDPFQKHSMYAISQDENVLVTAKTGSGKTLVGEFQIYHSLKKGKRIFYTTPIKSLSNQKFHDLKKVHPSVGIMTGDIKFCPQADIVIMTTEILRNLLYKKGEDSLLNLSLMNVDSVIFDEVHYINDPNRGKVWEECLAMLPNHINLVLLSATIDQPEHFASWLGETKQRPIHLISTQYRIVPLVHMLPNDFVVMDSKDIYYPHVYEQFYAKYYQVEDEQRRRKQRVANREEGQIIQKGEQNLSFIDRMNKLISHMELPALFFVFSRKLCCEYAKKVSHDLLTSSETADVTHIVNFHLRHHPELQQISQYHDILSLLKKGVAYHHSGLLPILKEIIEILFSRGFVKVLFATETFAVGINMPTKTVVFTGYRKYDDEKDSYRMLTTSEYIQMAGRAGRRGKDDKGIVIYLPITQPEEPLLVKQMMTGKSSTVSSQMDFGYDYVLSTMMYGKDFQENTYWMIQRKNDILEIQETIRKKKTELPTTQDDILDECRHRSYLEKLFSTAVNSEKKKLQGQLDSWKNKHFGKKWDDAWKEFRKFTMLSIEIEKLENKLIELLKVDETIHLRKQTLEELGFIEQDSLTLKGRLASSIHEGHPLLMAHMFSEKTIHDEPIERLICYLSMFLEEPDRTNDILRMDKLQVVREYAKQCYTIEKIQTTPNYWNVTEYWFEIVSEWLQGRDFICEEFGLDYGNFVRAMLKLSNIVEEWVNMATITQDVDMIEKCKDIRSKLIRGFVVPDSLYLRI